MITKVDRRLNASTCKEMRINARKEKEKISCVQDEQVEKVNNLLSLGAKVSVKGKRPDKSVGNLLKIGERRRHFELPSQNDE